MSEDDPHISVSVSELSGEQSPSQQIIELVGEHSDTPLVPNGEAGPDQVLPPLHSVVDTEALDSLIDSVLDGPTDGRVEFSYHGYTVVVRIDDPSSTVHVQPTQPAEPCSPSADD
ncbi:hypothetical protein GRX03_01790 [Halovenus sp. WSH3]|uniref:Halobacterial output domain-containing protein n=1 Tax=Halovenus carboxidivorans TaxID=2692199 RepID=A0A6B0T4W9_9EURY|nr:HalOD1 output domain-containing protein [Halovenus carboxidivorans]MXR50342.1 hypothetical protein [Halovenus carboxidivorans]